MSFVRELPASFFPKCNILSSLENALALYWGNAFFFVEWFGLQLVVHNS